MGKIINPYSGQKEFLGVVIVFLNDHRELLFYFVTFSYLQASDLGGLQAKNPIFRDFFFFLCSFPLFFPFSCPLLLT